MKLSRERIKNIVVDAIQEVNVEALTTGEEDEVADLVLNALADEAPELVEEEDDEEGEDGEG